MERSVGPMELENRMADMPLVSKFDVDDIGVEALLFQTGYLTIAEERTEGFRTFYRLDYPNLEVRTSLNDRFLAYLGRKGRDALNDGRELRALLQANDFAGFGVRLRSYLSAIPYQWHATGDLARYEAWYASLLHMCFSALGVDLRVEDASSHGRADMVVLTAGRCSSSSSGWRRVTGTRTPRSTRRSPRCAGGATRTGGAEAGNAFTCSAWHVGAGQGTSWR